PGRSRVGPSFWRAAPAPRANWWTRPRQPCCRQTPGWCSLHRARPAGPRGFSAHTAAFPSSAGAVRASSRCMMMCAVGRPMDSSGPATSPWPWGAPSPPAVGGETHGVPLPGNTLKIVDIQTGAVVPRGERGEIAIKGPTLMLGYIDVPIDETLDEDGFFRTGDGGYMDEAGRLVWEGR